MARGRKDKKKKDKPETPESSTQSSAPSVTDDTKQLLPEARGATSSHQSRNKKRKSKSVASEPSTPSSTPPSSELSVVGDDVSLLPSGARASSKDSKKAAGTGLPRTGLLNILSRSSPESTRGKNRLAVPDQGSGGSRSISSSPSKSPSALIQFTKSLATKFSPKKSPKRSIGSESQKGSTNRQKTEIADTKQKSLKDPSEATLKGEVQNTGSSNISGSSGRASLDDALQSENRLTVPGPKSIASSSKSPKKSILEQLKDKISPERKEKVHSKDSSSKSSSKSESSSSVISNISKKRQESNASNISSENSRSSNSKSSSVSCANNESLHPDIMHSCEGNSGDSVENTNCGSRQSKEVCLYTMRRHLIRTHKSGLNNQTVTQRLDNLYFTEKSRQRSRSFRCDVFVDQEKLSSSKDDSKAQQEDGSNHESQKRATGARSVEPIGNNSPGIGSNEIGVDIQGATASWSDSSVRRKDTATHRGDDAQSGEDRSDQSVRKKNTHAWRNVDAPSGVADRSNDYVRKDTAMHRGANAPNESRSDQSIRRKNTTAWRSDDAPTGVEADGSDEYVRKDTATHRGANAPSECRSDQSVRRKNTSTWRNVDVPSAVEADRLDKSIGKDAAQQSGAEARLSDTFSSIDTKPRRDDSLEVEAILKTPLAASPSITSTRHQSLSPRCGHQYIHTPDCSKTTKLAQRRIIRERRNQRKCKQPKSFNDTLEVVGKKRKAVRLKLMNLRDAREKLPNIVKHVNATVRNLNSYMVEIENRRPSLDTIDKYSSRLQEVREYFKRLREKIKEMIEHLDSSRLDSIKRNFSIYDKSVEKFIREIDADRIAVPGSNFSRLEEIRGKLLSFENRLEEIRINVGFSSLESISKNVLRIQSEMEEIKRTVNLDSIRWAQHEVWNIWHILQSILKID